MAGKITKELLNGVAEGSLVNGAILVKDYQVLETKKGSSYIAGTLHSSKDIDFKAWGNSEAFKYLSANECRGEVCFIKSKGNEYNGSVSLIVETVTAISDYVASDFLEVKYDAEAMITSLKKIVFDRLTPTGQEIANKVLFENVGVLDAFKKEFAAKSHHDNCVGGLLAHTNMVVTHTARLCADYKGIIKTRQELDLVMLGALFHDIGKIREMNFGIYQDVSIVTHRMLGVEFLAEHKDYMVKEYGELWYYNLLSILLQHHGEYAEPCKTVYAQIVHLADNYDAQLRTLADAVADKVVTDRVDIRFNTSYLSYGIGVKAEG